MDKSALITFPKLRLSCKCNYLSDFICISSRPKHPSQRKVLTYCGLCAAMTSIL